MPYLEVVKNQSKPSSVGGEGMSAYPHHHRNCPRFKIYTLTVRQIHVSDNQATHSLAFNIQDLPYKR